MDDSLQKIMPSDAVVFACDNRHNVKWDLPYVRFGGEESDCAVKCKNEICGLRVNADEAPKVYWLWKNIDELGANVLGYCQYRRFFTLQHAGEKSIVDIPASSFKREHAMTPLTQALLIKQAGADGILHPAISVVDKKQTPFTFIWEQMQILEGSSMLPDGMHKAAFDLLLEATPAELKPFMLKAFTVPENYLCNIFTVKKHIFKLFGSIAFTALPEVIKMVGSRAAQLHPYWLAYLLERYTSCFYHCMELAGHKFLKMPLMTLDGTKHFEWKQPQAERKQLRTALVCIAKDEDDYI